MTKIYQIKIELELRNTKNSQVTKLIKEETFYYNRRRGYINNLFHPLGDKEKRIIEMFHHGGTTTKLKLGLNKKVEKEGTFSYLYSYLEPIYEEISNDFEIIEGKIELFHDPYQRNLSSAGFLISLILAVGGIIWIVTWAIKSRKEKICKCNSRFIDY